MKRSKFSLSHYKLFSGNMGSLIPIASYEVNPGDSMRHSTTALIRFSPLLAPVMHPTHVHIHHWFIPNRLLWSEWEDFITGGPDGNNASVHPVCTEASGVAEGSLDDYLGVTPGVNNIEFSALFRRAYALVCNEFYLDQDLQTQLTVSTASGADTTTNETLQNVCWEKDYFTTSRPWEQKGTAVAIPIGTTAPIDRVSNAASWKAYQAGTNTLAAQGDVEIQVTTGNLLNNAAVDTSISLDPMDGLVADLSAATGIDINTLREVSAIQRFMENRARFGSRYAELLRAWGIRPLDARLQRPQYLGGGKQTIQFSEVLQTGVDSGDEGVGTLRGHGIAAVRSNAFQRFFEEHGIVISCMFIRPKTMYVQGMEKKFNRRTKYDYFQPEFINLGQQEVLNKEVYAAHASPNGIFGYQDRYDEYRRFESRVAGEFRSTLDYWHLGRIFSSSPALNASFVSCDPSTRIFASGSSADTVWVMANHKIAARRMLPKNSVPRLMQEFV